MIDFWEIAKTFKPGQLVQRYIPFAQGDALSPFVGKVLASHPGLGVVDVQWPHGHQRVSSDEIVPVDPRITRLLPFELNQMYSTYDTAKVAAWHLDRLPAEFMRDLSASLSKRSSDLETYDFLWRKYGGLVEDDLIKGTIKRAYALGFQLVDERLKNHIRKNAAYWVAQNRQYRATKGELQRRKFSCPRCGTQLRNATYRMEKGARVRLLACPKDLFLLERTSMLGPNGEALSW